MAGKRCACAPGAWPREGQRENPAERSLSVGHRNRRGPWVSHIPHRDSRTASSTGRRRGSQVHLEQGAPLAAHVHWALALDLHNGMEGV